MKSMYLKNQNGLDKLKAQKMLKSLAMYDGD